MEKDRKTLLPIQFIERMQLQTGDAIHDFMDSMHRDSPVSVRLHPLRWNGKEFPDKIPWCHRGFYLPERPSFTADPLFHGGAYYVQEPASMFLEQAYQSLHLPSPALMLDLCAAPGGKTTHLLSLMRPEDLLISNEVIRGRGAILLENVQKWGYPNVLVSRNDPQEFGRLKPIFDLIVADVPCSGEGLFRKDTASISEWSPDNTALCAARQKRILQEAWKCLKPGGFLIYSTCTYNPEENEVNIQWLHEEAGAFPVEITIEPERNIEVIRYKNVTGYQFYPHRTRSEGFFLGIVRKQDILTSEEIAKSRGENCFSADKRITDTLKDWILPDSQTTFMEMGDEYFLFPESWINLFTNLRSRINIIQAGTPIAWVKQKIIIPHPAFAHSIFLNKQYFHEINLGLKDAIRYLQKDSWAIGHFAKEWFIASYRNIPLGWLKNIGPRFNNYFPKERRIRMPIREIPLPWHERY